MVHNVLAIVRNNKKIIIVSAATSILTSLMMTALFIVLVVTQAISLNSFGSELTAPTGKPVPTGTAAETSAVINAVEKANPAVVSIVISKTRTDTQSRSFFNELFGIPQDNNRGNDTYESGGGSGFLVSSDGYIITNRHVVNDDSATYTVLTKEGKEYTPRVLAKDPILDVAVLKIEGDNFPYLNFANSDDIRVGQTAIAIGNALAEFQNTVSLGIISGLSRSIVASDSFGDNVEQLDEVIQTDAAINPGNSGGPLLDIKGNVIGVNVAVQDSAQSIGFSLPSNEVKAIADSVIKYGEIRRPYLGVRYIQITEAIARANDLSSKFGALVSSNDSGQSAVIDDSPADKAGIKEDDIIIEVDGAKLSADRSLASIIRSKKIGQVLKLKVIRDNKTLSFNVTLEKAPSEL